MTIATFLFLSESYPPIILAERGKKLEKKEKVGTARPTANASTVFWRSIIRPVRILLQSPIVTGLSLYLAAIYGYLYLLFTTFSTVFPDQYGFGIGILGLAFLGLGVDISLALLVLSWISDSSQARLTEKHGESKPE